MDLKIIFLAALVVFASTVTTAAMSFQASTPDKVWENIPLNRMVLYENGTTPSRPIDGEGPP